MARFQDPSWPRRTRDEGRGNHWREQEEARRADEDRERDYDFRYTRDDEGDSSVRAGNYDQGRVQYGRDYDRDDWRRRDAGDVGSHGRGTREQGDTRGRYSGYGEFGQGDYGGRRGDSPRGQRDYGGGNYAGDYGGNRAWRGRGGEEYDQGYGRQGGYGGDYGAGRYGEGGSRSRFELGEYGAGRGYAGTSGYGESDYGYGYAGYGGSQGSSAWRGHGIEGDLDIERGRYGARGAGVHRGKGPKGYQRSDDRLKEMLCERLREDPHIDASDVSLSVQNARVTFEGTVDSRHTKNLIEDVAEQLGVDDVQNNLRIRRGEAQGAAMGTSGQGRAATGTEQTRQNKH